jgi:hypothetical protein
MDTESLRFEAYREALKRCRWFLLITVTLSSLILSHTYLELFGFQQSMLRGITGHRMRIGTVENVEALGDSLRAVPATERDEKYTERLRTYSGTVYDMARTDNTLKAAALGDRTLPLLGLSVPSNDYLPVMAIILLIFSVSLWLNLRSAHGVLVTVRGDDSFKALARLFFTFTGLQDPSRQNPVARVVQYFAIWLPAIALFFASLADLIPPLLASHSNPHAFAGDQSAIAARVVVLALVFLGTSFSCTTSTLLAQRIDGQIRPASD